MIFRVTITTHYSFAFVRQISAKSTSEALDKAHDLYWPEYRKLAAMPAPTIH